MYAFKCQWVLGSKEEHLKLQERIREVINKGSEEKGGKLMGSKAETVALAFQNTRDHKPVGGKRECDGFGCCWVCRLVAGS